MRRALVAMTLLAAAACAGSDEDTPPAQQNQPQPTPSTDAGPRDEPPPDASQDDGKCSRAGWCVTTLPDVDLVLKDIWPVGTRAFAIAESPTLGVKALEWSDASQAWSYFDDNTQNTFDRATYAGKIWAPSENEVYFGAAPALLYHGKRNTPSDPWSWQRSSLDGGQDPKPAFDPARVSYWTRNWRPLEATALGVWGTSADNVYAWYGNTIFHWKSDGGGAPTWVSEYVAEDAENAADTFFVFGAAGSGPDDIWFAVGRGRFDASGIFRCPVLVHRTPDGYQRVVDTLLSDTDVDYHYYGACLRKEGVATFTHTNVKGDTSDWINGDWLLNIASVGPGRVAGIAGEDRFAYVEAGNDVVARINQVAARVPNYLPPALVSSVWIHESSAWISGWGIVLRAENDPARWSSGRGLYTPDDAQSLGIDAATFNYSSTALRGAPLDKPLYQVRGTSNTNLWAIGLHHALHKTTP